MSHWFQFGQCHVHFSQNQPMLQTPLFVERNRFNFIWGPLLWSNVPSGQIDLEISWASCYRISPYRPGALSGDSVVTDTNFHTCCFYDEHNSPKNGYSMPYIIHFEFITRAFNVNVAHGHSYAWSLASVCSVQHWSISALHAIGEHHALLLAWLVQTNATTRCALLFRYACLYRRCFS